MFIFIEIAQKMFPKTNCSFIQTVTILYFLIRASTSLLLFVIYEPQKMSWHFLSDCVRYCCIWLEKYCLLLSVSLRLCGAG